MKTTSVVKDSIKAKEWMRKHVQHWYIKPKTREELDNVWNKWQSLSNENRENTTRNKLNSLECIINPIMKYCSCFLFDCFLSDLL